MMVQYTLRRSATPALFPNRIREYRIRACLSQKRLAQLIGHRRSLISAWERGRCLPTLTNALRLAKALGTFLEALYGNLVAREPVHAEEEAEAHE